MNTTAMEASDKGAIAAPTGRRENVAFYPGFPCGLTFVGHYQIIILTDGLRDLLA